MSWNFCSSKKIIVSRIYFPNTLEKKFLSFWGENLSNQTQKLAYYLGLILLPLFLQTTNMFICTCGYGSKCTYVTEKVFSLFSLQPSAGSVVTPFHKHFLLQQPEAWFFHFSHTLSSYMNVLAIHLLTYARILPAIHTLSLQQI